MPDDEHEASDLPSEDQAFLEDLRAAYDNPEIYGNESIPQLFKLKIISSLLAGNPPVIRAEIDGDISRDNMLEVGFYLMSQDPKIGKTLEKFGDKDFIEFRQNFERDPEFARWQDAQWKFFLRHFPKFLASAHHIAVMSSFMAALLSMMREEPDEDLDEMEKLARETLEMEIARLQKNIKLMVGTRSSGRPKRIKNTARLPKEVKTVIDTARAMMGKLTGEDAVPGLKEIALAIDPALTVGALGKRLKRAGYPWTMIRSYLASPNPPPATNQN